MRYQTAWLLIFDCSLATGVFVMGAKGKVDKRLRSRKGRK